MKQKLLITGASRGIGRAAALRFARAGYLVGINYCRSREKAEALYEQIRAEGLDARLLYADVSKEEDVERMFAEFGRVDVLINNAGISCDKLFTDTSLEDWRKTFSVNMEGAFLCSRLALKSMLPQQKGVILNVSSMWGEVGGSCEVAYSASKGAMIAFTKALAKELGLSGIRVNCVSPGLIDTDMNAHLEEEDLLALCEETPLGRVGKPEDVADALLFLASDAASFITGQVLGVNGGLVI